MEFRLILALSTIIVSFTASFGGFIFYLKKPLPEHNAFLEKNLAFAPFYLTCLAVFCLLYVLTPIANDFIFEINIFSVLIPLILGGGIYLCSLFQKTAKLTPAAIFIAVAVSVFLLPPEFLLFKGYLPFWLDRIVIIIFWSLFSNFYYILNGIDGLAASNTFSITMGFIVFGLLDAIPLYYALAALCLTAVSGSFLIFNWYPSRLNFTADSCKVLGFILGWLLIFSSTEGLAPCNFILITFFILELLQALIKKISLRDRYNSLTANTTYYQANISGLSPTEICTFVLKFQILFIIFACFQLYTPNSYSLPFLSLIVGTWFLSKLKNWQTPNKGLHELNKDFMEDIRQNIEDIKNLGKN